MKTTKKIIAAALVSFIILSNMASAKSKQNDADSINVSSEAMNLYAGQKRTLTARTGRLGKVTAGVIWKSSNEKVSKVNKKGEVKAVKKGKAVITAVSKTNKKHKAKCRIKVREFKEKSFVVNKGEGVFFPLIYDDSNRISSFSVLKIHNKKEWDNFLDKYMKDDELKDIKNRYKKSFFEKNGILVYAASLRVYSDVSSVGFEYSIIQKDDGKINLSVGISETRPEVSQGSIIIDDFWSQTVCVPVSHYDLDSIDCITVRGETKTVMPEADR